MTTKSTGNNDIDLRRRAEEKMLLFESKTRESLSSEEAMQVIYELRVHQIELEMQNEELRRTQTELEAVRTRYFDLYDLVPVGYCTISEKGLILESNLTAATLLGVVRGAIVKQPLSRFILPEDQDIYYRHYKQLFETASPHVCEIRMLRTDVGFFWARLEATKIQDADGTQVYRTVISDITEHKRAEDQGRKLQEQLLQARKMEAVGTLSAGIAHDFNNILQGINGFAELLLANKNADDPEYKYAMLILKSGKRAAGLVRQLLQYSQKMEGERRSIDVNQEVRKSIVMLQRAIPRMIQVELILGNHLWSVNADPVQIEQILLYLGSNAADSMPDGGKLIISTGNITLDNNYSNTYLGANPGNHVLLKVSDSGCGMEEETIEHIFDPFFTTKGLGKGLSLASVYGIVKSIGGHIVCFSKAGQGTTFKIYLPAIEQERLQPGNDTEPAIPTGGTETILVVDDESSQRDMLSDILKRFGYTVLCAGNGERALEKYQSRKSEIDLIILDLSMPGMGGRKCLRELLKIDPSAKIIIASGYSANDYAKEALLSEAASFIDKPYDLKSITAMVRNVLDKRKIASD